MVGHDPDDLPAPTAQAQMAQGPSDSRGTLAGISWCWPLLAIVAGAVAIGAFLGSLALAHGMAVAAGATMPSASWLQSWQDWLPLFCIGFGCARLVVSHGTARTAVRGLAIGAVFALGVGQAVYAPTLPGLRIATATVVGLVLGLHCDSVRRSSWLGMLVAGLFAAAAALVMLAVPRPAECLGVALVASLVALVIDAPQLPSLTKLGPRWPLVAATWVAVVVVCGLLLATSSVADVAVLSGFVAVVLAAAVANRLPLALGAVTSMLLLLQIGNGYANAEANAGPASARDSAGSSQLLAQSGKAMAIYRRANQELQLQLDGEVLAAAGPDRFEEPLLIALLHASMRDGDRVLLLGGGTGRVQTALQRSPRCLVDIATAWPELAELQPLVSVDGPVAPPHVDGPSDHLSVRPLASLASGSRQFVVLGELPTTATSHRATRTFQRQLRRVVGDGVICQPIALDRVSPALLASWFDVVSQIHPCNAVYAVGNAAVLVSSGRELRLRASFASWSEDARWAMHAAHLGGPDDLRSALLGTVKHRSMLASGAPVGHDVARQLLRWLAAPVVGPAPLAHADRLPVPALGNDSRRSGPVALLRSWRQRRAERHRAKGRILALANDAAGRAEAQAIAARFLPAGAPESWLQAALGLAGEDGVALRDARLASRCAHALDPTFFQSAAAIFATLPLPNQKCGDLEDLFRVEVGPRLARRCSGVGPQAVALRARFASRCARSLVAQLAEGPLSADAGSALRELADAFVLEEAVRVLLPAGRWRELLALWRADLSAPKALQHIASKGKRADRVTLAAALRGRQDPSCHALIATFLVADDLELRFLAGEALRLAVGDRVPFDAQWPRSRRLDAASRLADLHNRKP